jgi:ABC-type nickel/cobalt efflux system permease component RcnA
VGAVTATVLGAVLTAGALGVTHALEPDHVAGISSLTSQYGDSRLSALVGVCFSAGHVVLVVAWLALAYVVLGRTSFPAVLDTVGTLAVALFLGAFGVFLAVQGYRVAARAHVREDHDRGEPPVHLPLVGSGHDHTHSMRAYLKTGVVGALFTLSPPLSMIAFASTIVPVYGFGVVAVTVAAYAAGITVTMALLGAGVGAAFGLTRRRRRLFGAARLLTGLAVFALATVLVVDLAPALL